MGSRPWLPTRQAPPVCSPQGYFELERLPDNPDVAQEAGSVDTRGTHQAAPASDRTAGEVVSQARAARPLPGRPAGTHLLAMRK